MWVVNVALTRSPIASSYLGSLIVRPAYSVHDSTGYCTIHQPCGSALKSVRQLYRILVRGGSKVRKYLESTESGAGVVPRYILKLVQPVHPRTYCIKDRIWHGIFKDTAARHLQILRP